jgi:hypothetical protein
VVVTEVAGNVISRESAVFEAGELGIDAGHRGLEVSQVLQSDGYGVREKRLWCWRVMVIVSERNGYGVGE